MARTAGSKNITRFEDRRKITTTRKASVLHIANDDLIPLNQFKGIIKNQNNYLGWLKNMRDQLANHKSLHNTTNNLTGRCALSLKNTPYNKYSWYVRQILLLELINGFEVFYKTSIVKLAESIKPYINPESLKGDVDAKILWHANENASLMALIYEKKLFHDVSSVDEATNSLICKKRYNPNNKNSPIYKAVVRKLEAIFQIRHTLSHNSGLVTESDAAKLKILGYNINTDEAIDPSADRLDLAIARFLREEAEQFTTWLRIETKSYLASNTIKITPNERDQLKKYFGGDDTFWGSVTSN